MDHENKLEFFNPQLMMFLTYSSTRLLTYKILKIQCNKEMKGCCFLTLLTSITVLLHQMSVGQTYFYVSPCFFSEFYSFTIKDVSTTVKHLSFEILYSCPFCLKYPSITESIFYSLILQFIFNSIALSDFSKERLQNAIYIIYWCVLQFISIPLTFCQVSNQFIHVTVDFIVFLFLFLSINRFKSVSVAALKALI